MMYSPPLGTFLTRDPLPLAGKPDVLYDNNWFGERLNLMRNLYAYANNNPPRYVDPMGEKACNPPIGQAKSWCDCAYSHWFWTAEALRALSWCKCLSWHESESARGGAWLSLLPSCPCTIGSPPANPAPNVWDDPKSPGALERPGHPFATYCMRSKPTTPGNHGQQCCYDSAGNLITGGPSAGSPDFASPAYSTGQHYKNDVDPFYQCKKVDCADVYFKHRPPNNGLNCPKNEV
jgi:RHS repeat-associated protein